MSGLPGNSRDLDPFLLSKTDNAVLFASAVPVGNYEFPSISALINVQSTAKGFLPPCMTTVQRNAVSAPVEGLMIYNTTTHKLNMYTNGAWGEIAGGGGGGGGFAADGSDDFTGDFRMTDATPTITTDGATLTLQTTTSGDLHLDPAGSVYTTGARLGIGGTPSLGARLHVMNHQTADPLVLVDHRAATGSGENATVVVRANQAGSPALWLGRVPGTGQETATQAWGVTSSTAGTTLEFKYGVFDPVAANGSGGAVALDLSSAGRLTMREALQTFRGTSLNLAALAGPAPGMVAYDTDLDSLMVRNAEGLRTVCAAPAMASFAIINLAAAKQWAGARVLFPSFPVTIDSVVVQIDAAVYAAWTAGNMVFKLFVEDPADAQGDGGTQLYTSGTSITKASFAAFNNGNDPENVGGGGAVYYHTIPRSAMLDTYKVPSGYSLAVQVDMSGTGVGGSGGNMGASVFYR